MNRTDLQQLAEERLTDARLLLGNGRFSAAYYLAGYVIECALKACIAKLTKAEDFPIRDSKQTVYIHNLTKLAQAAGISDAVGELSRSDREFARKWTLVNSWSEESRYDRSIDRETATAMLEAVSNPHSGRSSTLYKTILVKELIEDGDRLLRELDRRKFPISAAFWYDSPERGMWHLYIVTEVVHQAGPLEAYSQIQQAMDELDGPSLSLDDIIVMGPRSTPFRELHRTIEGVSQMGASGKRVSLEGAAHEDAYIYRWLYD